MTGSAHKGLAAALLATAALAGCETTTAIDDSATVDDYNEMAIAYNDLRADVQAMDLSTSVDMPTVGSASYAGYATVLVDTPVDSALVGDAQITADFTSSTLTGTLDNFVGTVDGSDYANYSGALSLTNGDIGVGTAGALAADLSGTLTSSADRLTITGGVEGAFRSDGVINAAGLTAADTAATDFIVNGRGYEGDIGIVAIR